MKLIELQGSVDQNGELAIPRTLLVDMGLRPGDSVRLTYASGSGAMDNTHRQFVVTPDGIVILPADILDRLPDDLRALFADLGIDPDTVREVMKEGGFPL